MMAMCIVLYFTPALSPKSQSAEPKGERSQEDAMAGPNTNLAKGPSTQLVHWTESGAPFLVSSVIIA